MKRVAPLTVLSAAALACFPLVAHAGGPIRVPGNHFPHTPPRAPQKAAYEAIDAVDVGAGTVTIMPVNGKSTATRVLKVTAHTEVTLDGNKATLGELHHGMKVEVGLGMDADVAATLTAHTEN